MLRERTGAWRPPRARIFLQIGRFRWPDSTWWRHHRTVVRFDTSFRSTGSCPWGFWWPWSRLWLFPTILQGFGLWGTMRPPQKHSRASASWALHRDWESPWGKSASRGYKKPHAPNTDPSNTFNTVNAPGNQKDVSVRCLFHGDWFCAFTSLHIIFWTFLIWYIEYWFSHIDRGKRVNFYQATKSQIQKSCVQAPSLTFVLMRNQIMVPCKSLKPLHSLTNWCLAACVAHTGCWGGSHTGVGQGFFCVDSLWGGVWLSVSGTQVSWAWLQRMKCSWNSDYACKQSPRLISGSSMYGQSWLVCSWKDTKGLKHETRTGWKPGKTRVDAGVCHWWGHDRYPKVYPCQYQTNFGRQACLRIRGGEGRSHEVTPWL